MMRLSISDRRSSAVSKAEDPDDASQESGGDGSSSHPA